MTDDSLSRDPLPVCSAGGPCEQCWHGQGCPLFDVVHPALPLLTMTSPTLRGALMDGLGEAVVTHDMPKPCKIPSLDSCQKRFLSAHKKVDVAMHTDVAKFPQVLGFKSLDPFLRVSKQGSCLAAIKEDGDDRRLVQLEHACKANGAVLPEPV